MIKFENNQDYFKQIYGVEMCSVKEWYELPLTIRQTIDNKIDIVDACGWIIKFAEQVREKAKQIQAIDDEAHSAAVSYYGRLVNNAREVMRCVACYNGNESLD